MRAIARFCCVPMWLLMAICLGLWVPSARAAVRAAAATAIEAPAANKFRKDIKPILTEYCGDCHMDGAKKGNRAFDEFASDDALLNDHDLWWAVLKNVRAGIMPPPQKPRPPADAVKHLEDWIKYGAFAIDPKLPDPGRVTVRRLNRVEYRNTIRDLMGVDFETENEFPPDDTGYGFDNIGEVLTLSPLLLEKYVHAARTIVAKAVPTGSGAAADQARARNRERFFPGTIPTEAADRKSYAADLLGKFATRAFRRPVDRPTVERLASLAESIYSKPGKTFEAGIAQAMTAVLASPRFLFREETSEPGGRPGPAGLIDEYALASRLSYFLWSSMPDDELFRLAAAGELRKNLDAQVKRMSADTRSRALVRNFTGQWLQVRDIDNVAIDARAVFAREDKADPERERLRARFRELRSKSDEELTAAEKQELAKMRAEFPRRLGTPRTELDTALRQAMRREAEMYFDYIAREDRSVVEFIDSDYAFLNERLARHYGLTNLNVTGNELRRVELPPDSPRGGVLSMGTVLVVTSNPTRTSPVKRGLFILDNILGMPPPPPPPDVPPLEDAAKDFKDHEPTLRETLEMHRNKPLCNSCHNRMDPLGLALENFNALGIWRDKERGQAVEVSGKLMTGESFADPRELKRVLARNHRRDFYRCLTEKLLTYAIGRGLDYYDVETVDQIVERLEHADGRFSALLTGVIASAPFQKCRTSATMSSNAPKTSPTPMLQRAEAKINR